jgi:uncharacterized protein (PEP-CTERM system associated)
MPTRPRSWRAAAGLLLLTWAPLGAAQYGLQPDLPLGTAGWTVQTDLTLREIYTDNAFLGVGEPRHDFVTEVTPGIRINGRSPRLTANFSYRPSALFYARNDQANDVVNNLAAFARLEAIERFFFVEAFGNISQSFFSPFAPRPGEIAINTANRTETSTVGLSPYLRGRLGAGFEYELRNRHTWTRTDNNNLGDFYTRDWFGRFASPMRLFGWALEYYDTVTEVEDDLARRPDQESRLYRARLYYQPDPAWRFSVSAGEEENNYIARQTQRDTIYGAGVAWNPGPRTSAEFQYEHRFFGPSRLARVNHRTRLTAWNLAYSRNTSTYQEEVLRIPPGNTTALLNAIFAARIPDPTQRRAAVEEFMRGSGTPATLSSSLAFYTQRVYLREAIEASFGILGVRNSITFTAFYAENSNISADVIFLPDAFLFANRFDERGFIARFDHKLTPVTTLSASAHRVDTRRIDPPGPKSRNDYVTLTLNHVASPKTNVFAGVSITRFDSEDSVFADNQDANSLFVGLTHRF